MSSINLRDQFTDLVEVDGWRIAMRGEIGSARPTMQDTAVIIEDALLPGDVPGIVCAVFDGLGGVSHGALAARTACEALEAHAATDVVDERILDILNDAVIETNGATTAVILALPIDPKPGTRTTDLLSGWIHTIGDSSAYIRRVLSTKPATLTVERLTEHDRISRHVLTEYLGKRKIRSHTTSFPIEPEATFLLCSDGLDGTLDAARVASILEADAGAMEESLSRAFEEVLALGAPDNTTAVLVRRIGR